MRWEGHLPGGASRAAAGLLNPLAGKGFNSIWNLPVLQQAVLDAPWLGALRPVRVFRPFVDVAEQNLAAGGTMGQLTGPLQQHLLKNPFGGILVNGYAVDLPAFLQTAATYLSQQPGVEHRNESFELAALNPETMVVAGEKFGTVVFAEGALATQNPWWPTEALRPLKGQALVVELPELALDFALARGVYLLPLGEQNYVLGGTYEKQFSSPHPTAEAKKQLLVGLRRWLPRQEVRVLEQRAGIRATTKDRRPYLGPHPQFTSLWFLNGLGTRGLWTAPWLAKLLVSALAKNDPERVPIPTAVSLLRHALR